MHTSLTISPFKAPLIFPLHPMSPPQKQHHGLSLPTHVSPVNSLKGSGCLSTIGQAIREEEEYRKARAQVLRKGIELEGYTIEGISIGGQETCVIVPELKCAFDIGRCPSRATQQNFVFITHAHLDHIGGLPMYVSSRGLYNLKPPTVFVPPCIKDDVEKLFEIHRTMGQVELNLDLVALDVGDTYEMRNNLVVRPFRTQHVIPSQITDIILSPEVAFTGDTTSYFMLDPRNADALRAKVLITEVTFVDEGFSIEHAREHGHTHLFEIMEHAQGIRNKAVLLTHFSSRYNIEDIHQAVSKLQPKLSAKVVPLIEGFKSMYS